MLTLLYVAVVLFGSVLLFTWMVGWLVPNPSAGDIEVRLSPEETIKDMTVNEFRDLAGRYLDDLGYDVERGETELTVRRDGESCHVEFDFEAKAANPRAINSLLAEQKQRGSDRLILFTLATVDGQAEKLAERSGIEIVEPDTLIDWKRDQSRDPTTETSPS